jgi:predicted RND superfamily exporter protein
MAHGIEDDSPAFASWASYVIKHKTVFLCITLACSVFLGHRAVTTLHLDNSMEAFTDQTSATHKALLEFRKTYGRDDLFLVAISGDVFSLAFLNDLKALHQKLETLDVKGLSSIKPVKKIQGLKGFEEDDGWGRETGGAVFDEVVSLINYRDTRYENDTLTVGELTDTWPTPSTLSAWKHKVLSNPRLVSNLVDTQGAYTVITLRTQVMSDMDMEKVRQALITLLKPLERPGFDIMLSGMPAFIGEMNTLMLSDFRTLFMLSGLFMVCVFAFVFRHPFAVFASLAVVVLGIVWMFGIMALVGLPMTMLSTILPAFLICTGIGEAVHILSVYRDMRKQGMPNNEAVVHAVANTGVPIFYTCFTTLLGLLSFRTASAAAIREMGTAGAIGVGCAWLHTMVFLPAVMTFNRTSLLGAAPEGQHDFLDRILHFCDNLSKPLDRAKAHLAPWKENRKLRVLTYALLLATALSFSGVFKLKVWHNPLTWLPSRNHITLSFDLINAHLGGTSSVQFMIHPKSPAGMRDLETMKRLEAFEQYVLAYKDPKTQKAIVSHTMSILDVVKETHQALHEGKPEYYVLPDTPRGLSDALFMFENAAPHELRRLATTDLSEAQLTARMLWQDATAYLPLATYLNEGIEKYFKDVAEVRPTGAVYSLVTTISQLIYDQVNSFGTAFLVTALSMMWLLKSFKLGLISMIPNLLPIAAVMGLMGFIGIPIDMSTVLIGSIAMGVSVDDTVHYMHHFRRSYMATGDVERSIQDAMLYCGRPMLVTSLILVLGFSVYLVSALGNLQRFGFLISLTVSLAMLYEVVVSPAVLRLFYKDKETL